MKLLVLGCAAAALVLSACGRPANASLDDSGPHGRYAGVGIYPAGSMWPQIAGLGAPKTPDAPKLSDDEQIIVVVDNATGAIRECGNLTGYCVGMQPWDKAMSPTISTPVALSQHADQMGREADGSPKAK